MLLKRKLLASVAVCCMLLGSVPVFAADADATPGAGAMVADALVARPLGLVVTTLGAVAFVVSLPFSALGGNVKEAADTLVIGPGKETFVRCLGCRNSQ
ncbi:MAG: hypothetical protein GXP16_02480 [Gammaproteobacteria bacterium]|nr:hypothetical protein [Gammaproteobacteria bacterium]